MRHLDREEQKRYKELRDKKAVKLSSMKYKEFTAFYFPDIHHVACAYNYCASNHMVGLPSYTDRQQASFQFDYFTFLLGWFAI